MVISISAYAVIKFRREDLDRYIASQTVVPMNVRDIKSPIDLREVIREPRLQDVHKNR
jgi:hypothetical protein